MLNIGITIHAPKHKDEARVIAAITKEILQFNGENSSEERNILGGQLPRPKGRSL